MTDHAVRVEHLVHHYGERKALDDVSFTVERGEIFGLLGPNGGGKTTLFRILSTIFGVEAGNVSILGLDVATQKAAVRGHLGVVFQAPSLDKKLRVEENLLHHGHLYGLSGVDLAMRIDEVLERVSLTDRRRDLVETLSGGLARRVELAKGLLHRPEILLLDEPSTGLDPGARRDLMTYLRRLQDDERVTVLVTTHILEEADTCDRLAILNQGKLVACGTPDELKARIGGEVVDLMPRAGVPLKENLESRLSCSALEVEDGSLRVEVDHGASFVARAMEAFGGDVQSIRVGRPTLEDVFVRETGHRFWDADAEGAALSNVNAPTKRGRRRG
ncbi:MAG: ABC transporter ATP-binding protein [Planctomycetes bacterium]|nr:ABC transporter ATP-binding protein [Planctomycetota bacterium]